MLSRWNLHHFVGHRTVQVDNEEGSYRLHVVNIQRRKTEV